MNDENAKTLESLLYGILPLVEAIGAKVVEAGPGRVKMSMARAPLIVNHIGAFHAGALYTFAETAAGAAIAMSFDLMRLTIVNKRGQIDYLKLATERVDCEASLAPEDAARIASDLESRGRSVFTFNLSLKNPDGQTAAKVAFDFLLKKPGMPPSQSQPPSAS